MSFGDKNDTFGCINNDDDEMEIDNASNNNSTQNITPLFASESDLINKKITDSLDSISHIITTKQSFMSYHSLFSLPQKSFSPIEYNQFKSSIIVKRMTRTLLVFLGVYKRKLSHLLHRRFLVWIRKNRVELHLKQSKSSIEAQFIARFVNKKKDIEQLINAKHKEVNQIKEKVNALNETIGKMNKTLKANEEREGGLNKTAKDLQEENSHLEEDMRKSSKSTESSSINTSKAKMISRISELEQSIKTLDEEMREKDSNIAAYVKEMNEMLDVFEQKANKFNINSEEGEDRHKWKSPTNPRTSTLKNSFNVLPNNNNSLNNNGNYNSTPNNTNTSQGQQKLSYNQSQSKQGLKLQNTINMKTHQGANATNNTSNTSRGIFINITGSTNVTHKK